ncbi:MAG: hypothetical protein U1C46_03635 [Bacteroidales bacterium]|nr:hypothetical protein [Bacteroidales bacterium]MDZ4203892.1 hypothetical protein [Bacteroidales bacterium]
MKLVILRFSFFSLFTVLLCLYSCRDNANDGIPAYIQIDKISLITQPAQGTASHKITDAWVFIGDELIGAFELPVTFPVLKTGSQEITIQAGIKINGISATRAPYPFYNPLIVSVNLEAGSITRITDLVTTYKSNAVFAWMENFEGNSISIDTTVNSQTGFRKISTASLIFDYPGEQNNYSAMASFSGSANLFECASVQQYLLPRNDSPVFVELNYRSNNLLTTGVFAYANQQVSQKSILVLNPTATWNKVYINLTPTVQLTSNATGFKVFLGALRDANVDTAQVFFDNLKLIHF